MFKILKPFFGPIVLIALERAIQLWLDPSPMLTGAVFGVAGFWLLMAIFGNRALFKRFPGILEFAPFLDPAGAFAKPGELTGKYLTEQTFRIADIVYDGMIKGRTINNCHIYGPAVIVPLGENMSTIAHAHLVGTIDSGLIEITQDRVQGVIAIDGCYFENCWFHNIAFMGPPEFCAQVRASFKVNSDATRSANRE